MTDTPDSHTVRNGTFLHGGPREGCTLPGCAPAPVAVTVTASDVLVQHDATRKAMCDALGEGWHLNWQQIIDASQRSHNANTEWQREFNAAREQLAELIEHRKAGDKECARLAAELDQAAINAAVAERETRQARQGEAEAIRARAAAEQRERDAERGVTNIRNEYEALLERWRQTCAELQRVKDSAGKTAAALRETENQLGEARKRIERDTADYNAAVDETEQYSRRAKQAEAKLAAVRKAVASAADCRDGAGCTTGHLGSIEAALGDPQPATPEVCCVCGCPDVTYHNFREQPFCCRCAECCEPPVLCAHGCQPPAKPTPVCVCPEGKLCAAHSEVRAEPLADAVADLADAYRAYLIRRRTELADAMRVAAAAFRSGGV